MLSGVGLFKGRLRDVAGGGAWVAVVSCLSSNRRDLRVGLSLSGLCRGGSGQGQVSSVRLISCMSSGTLGSSSPVRVYRRRICERWCACAWLWRRTGIVP